jgi:hypothetical protein
MQCGISISQPRRPAWSVTGIALILYIADYDNNNEKQSGNASEDKSM